MTAKETIDKALQDNRVMVFSKSYCPFCTKAKNALQSLLDRSQFTVMELDGRDDGDEIQDELLTLTGGRTVPRVFIDGKFIGGGDETASLARSGALKEMLTQKGILV